MVGAKKWSKMKPMVENNLTTFFWSDMGTDLLTIVNLKTKAGATIFVLLYVLPKTQIRSVRRSPAAFTGYRLVL